MKCPALIRGGRGTSPGAQLWNQSPRSLELHWIPIEPSSLGHSFCSAQGSDGPLHAQGWVIVIISRLGEEVRIRADPGGVLLGLGRVKVLGVLSQGQESRW